MTAVNARDTATLTSTMTEDVELLDDAATVKGRAAAIHALGELATRGRLVGTTREITIANDIAWHVVGLAQTQKNGDVHALGQALEIWKRVNREWKLHRRMTTGVVTPGDLLTRPSTREPVLDSQK
jgi:ketosteroid isomerase-like protein